MLCDTHCHVQDKQFDKDRANVIERAFKTGIDTLIAIGCDTQTSLHASVLAKVHDRVFFSAGFHPHEAKLATKRDIKMIAELLGHKKCVALGECGLDYYYEHSPKKEQLDIFETQIQLAISTKKPLIVHMRDSFDDTYAMLSTHKNKLSKVVIHCFSDTLKHAQQLIDLGFFISLSGIVTFTNATEIQEVAKAVPLDQLLIETDCPYLAPIPYRGKRNEPAYLNETAQQIAKLRQLELPALKSALKKNVKRAFGI